MKPYFAIVALTLLLVGCVKSSDSADPEPVEKSPALMNEPLQDATTIDDDISDILWSDFWPKAATTDSELIALSKTQTQLRIVGRFSARAFQSAFEGRAFEYIMISESGSLSPEHVSAIASAKEIDRLDFVFRYPGADSPELMDASWATLTIALATLRNVEEVHLDCDAEQWERLPLAKDLQVTPRPRSIVFRIVPSALSPRMSAYVKAFEAAGCDLIIHYDESAKPE